METCEKETCDEHTGMQKLSSDEFVRANSIIIEEKKRNVYLEESETKRKADTKYEIELRFVKCNRSISYISANSREQKIIFRKRESYFCFTRRISDNVIRNKETKNDFLLQVYNKNVLNA